MQTSLNEPGRQPRPALGSVLTRAMAREAPAHVVDAVVDWLARVDGSALGDADRVTAVASLERLRGASAAAQARVTMSFAASTETLPPAEDPSSERARDRSIGLQLALARSESPSSGDGHLALARALSRDLPHTMRSLTRGEISEEKAAAVHRATAQLAPDTRRAVDAHLSADLASHNRFQVGEQARRLADELDPDASVERARHEAGERRVSARAGRDGMGYLTIYGPMLDVAGAMVSLDSYADSVAQGVVGDDPLLGRRRANVMTDHALEVLSGRRPGQPQPVEVHVVVGAAGLFGPFGPSGPLGGGWSDSPKAPETRNAAHSPGARPSNNAEQTAARNPGRPSASVLRPGTMSPVKAEHPPADLVRPVDPGSRHSARPEPADIGVARDRAAAPMQGSAVDPTAGSAVDPTAGSAVDPTAGSADGREDGSAVDPADDSVDDVVEGDAVEAMQGPGAGTSMSATDLPEASAPGLAPSAVIPGVGAMSSAALRAALGLCQAGSGGSLTARRDAERPVWLRRLFTDASGTRLIGMDRRRRNLPWSVRQWIARSQGDIAPKAQSGDPLVPPDVGRWLRTLDSRPGRGDLVAWSSPTRGFTGLLRRFLVLRDIRCRTPFCAAPIRDIDHVVPVREGGRSHVADGRGACRRCNLDKELLGWFFRVADRGLPDRQGAQRWDDVLDALLFDLDNPSPPGMGHRLTVTTPTGHQYTSSSGSTGAVTTPVAEPP